VASARYSRTISYLEKVHDVPPRTRYWEDGVEIKDLVSAHATIREFDGAWVLPQRVVGCVKGRCGGMRRDGVAPGPGSHGGCRGVRHRKRNKIGCGREYRIRLPR
jgi:hypothetical protein